ncbi:hypothetical protein ACIRTB_30130 [Streptomyces sp. NPDC101158]|uniref:hypothetical protein n=1 Tax=Streptomyces sp. NPDC101158 TaxID=3366117 RepID=UPI0037F2EBCC
MGHDVLRTDDAVKGETFQGAGWRVRPMPTAMGAPGVVAGRPDERTVAQVAVSDTGAVLVAVTTPLDGPQSADV